MSQCCLGKVTLWGLVNIYGFLALGCASTSRLDPGVHAIAPLPTSGNASTTTRPFLSPENEAKFTVLSYLATAGDVSFPVTDNWDPRAGAGDPSTFTPTFHIAKSGGTHTTVQAAIDAAVAMGKSKRIYIQLDKGTYREVVCVPTEAPPITLYASNTDVRATSVVYNNYSGKPKPVGTPANPCEPNLHQATFSTFGSATFAVYADGFAAKNMTFINDTNEAEATGAIQAVALMTRGDQLVFDNVAVLGHQDTLFVKTPNVSTVTRAYFKNCYIEGDVDFIFGRGTLVLDQCTIHVLNQRTRNGVILAPSTDSRNPYGFLVTHSTFTAEPDTATGSIHLGRAWDERQVNLATYQTHVALGVYPNGQAVIRDSILGPHIATKAPWRAAATTRRPYSVTTGSYPANRMAEANNRGLEN